MLRSELRTDPAGVGYAPYLPDVGGNVERLINDKAWPMAKARFVTARTILAELDEGGAILAALDQVAKQNVTVRYAVTFLSQDSGIDVGNPRTAMLIDGLAAAGALTPSQATALKGMAVSLGSRAEALGCDYVGHAEIMGALVNDDGSDR